MGPVVNPWDELRQICFSLPGTLAAICIHEMSHGLMSYALGDPTPKREGRISLNPLRHLDPMGVICLVVLHFGWAKPVRIAPQYYKNRKLGIILVSLAGPVSNFILAFVSLILYGLAIVRLGDSEAGYFLQVILWYSAVINVGLGTFNLIPIPPLDGSHVAEELFPPLGRFFAGKRNVMPVILVALLMTGLLTGPLGQVEGALMDRLWIGAAAVLRRIL